MCVDIIFKSHLGQIEKSIYEGEQRMKVGNIYLNVSQEELEDNVYKVVLSP